MGRPAIVTREPIALSEHELLARIFRTLGDPTRLKMLEALERSGVASQSELITEVGATQSRASEHLATLSWCGFVEPTRQGRTVRYTLSDDRALALLRLAREFLTTNERAVGGCTVAPEPVPAPDMPAAAASVVPA
jgi:ArsR family transcriptional regulator, cadmium/lead-responsive transcriptional repressor